MKADDLRYRTLLRDQLDAVQARMLGAQRRIPRAVAENLVHLVNGGGKRLRPALVLLSAHVCGATAARALPVAAAVEMLHTATLIHDDLIDEAETRRGVRTLNATWPPSATVLVGDVAFAWAARMATEGGSTQLTQHFAETLETICQGELNQMFRDQRGIPTEQDYYDRIYAKTASLFALSAEAGALLAKGSAVEGEARRFRRFGRLVGEAFQIVDDVLDLTGDPEILGKPVGSDLRQGLITLPVLGYHHQHPDDARIQAVLDAGADEVTVQALIDDIRRSDAGEWAMARARARVNEARALLAPYPDTPYRQALDEIAAFAVGRRF